LREVLSRTVVPVTTSDTKRRAAPNVGSRRALGAAVSVGEWVLVGLAIWVVGSVVLGLVVARFLRSVDEQDGRESDADEMLAPPNDEFDDVKPDDTVRALREGGRDEVDDARRRRRSG
jgi:hypothetical protein